MQEVFKMAAQGCKITIVNVEDAVKAPAKVPSIEPRYGSVQVWQN